MAGVDRPDRGHRCHRRLLHRLLERIRDEVRDGRTLRTAVDTGWKRAKRTIVVADGVNFLGALVLTCSLLSSVRGFAFTSA